MSELISYKCPSCGANLKPAADQPMITCSFCGSVFEHTLSEGEQHRISASKLAVSAEKYKADLSMHQALEAKTLRLADEVSRLSQEQTPQLPFWAAFAVPIQIALTVLLLFVFVHAYKASNTPLMICATVIWVGSFIVTVIAENKKNNAQKQTAVQREQLQNALGELTAARNELSEFEKSFDIDAIPKDYRNSEALDYIIGLFHSSQAGKLSDAFKRCDEYFHMKKMEALQSEQVEIQKKQLEKLEELSDYGFDDTYDDDDFELAQTVSEMKNGLNEAQKQSTNV